MTRPTHVAIPLVSHPGPWAPILDIQTGICLEEISPVLKDDRCKGIRCPARDPVREGHLLIVLVNLNEAELLKFVVWSRGRRFRRPGIRNVNVDDIVIENVH